jgi:hypothetical protein
VGGDRIVAPGKLVAQQLLEGVVRELGLLQAGPQPMTLEAFDSDGGSAGTASMSGPQSIAETLTVAGASIEGAMLRVPQDEALLPGPPPQAASVDGFRAGMTAASPGRRLRHR